MANASATDLPALPSCSPAANAGPSATARLCSGTGGAFFPGTAQVPNNSSADAATAAAAGADTPATVAGQVLVRYNNALMPPAGSNAAEAAVRNPCVSTGVPTPADLTPGSANPAWNVVGTCTGQGCCVPPGLPVGGGVNNRTTRLTPFSTASAPGAQNSDNLAGGIPMDLTALSKAWGIASVPKLAALAAAPASLTQQYFLHCGTHASNVGMWLGNFTVKYAGAVWTQPSVLWCRQTGDSYDPAADPFGTLAPAMPGTCIQPGPPAASTTCKTCAVDQISNGDTGCNGSTPYFQNCSVETVTADVLTVYKNLAAKSPQPGVGASTAPQTPQSRCGGCFTTRDQYGPGSFAVLANLPPTALQADADPALLLGTGLHVNALGQYGTDKVPESVPDGSSPTASNLRQGAPGGRGYVFALWTFNYTEAYPSPPTDETSSWPYSMVGETDPPGTTMEAVQSGTFTNVPLAAADWPAVGNTTIMTGDPEDLYTIHNHEIDIEIPANSAQMYTTDPGNAGPGLDTANFNTWLTDIGDYDPGTAALYQQVQSTRPTGQFYAAVGPDDDDDTYHEYKFVWVVDPTEGTAADASPDSNALDMTTSANTYVAFLLDGVEQWRTHRFVPRRSGRVVFGLWPGWWGTGKRPMAYNQVYAKIARVDFVPQAGGPSLVTNAPQMYDQLLPDGTDISCGVQASPVGLNRKGVQVPWMRPQPKPQPDKSHDILPWWAWLLIAVGVAGIVAVSVWQGTRKKPRPS